MNKWLPPAAIVLSMLFGWLLIEFHLQDEAMSGLREELATLETRQSLSWFRQTVFEGRVRGLQNSTFVFFGHPAAAGFYITIGEEEEQNAVGVYDAGLYVNIPTSAPLSIVLRQSGGEAVSALVLEGLSPGDLVIGWYSEQPTLAETSPDDWGLPAALLTQEGLIVAVEHFSGATE